MVDGLLTVAGGSMDISDENHHKAIEKYIESNGQWSVEGYLQHSRFDHSTIQTNENWCQCE